MRPMLFSIMTMLGIFACLFSGYDFFHLLNGERLTLITFGILATTGSLLLICVIDFFTFLKFEGCFSSFFAMGGLSMMLLFLFAHLKERLSLDLSDQIIWYAVFATLFVTVFSWSLGMVHDEPIIIPFVPLAVVAGAFGLMVHSYHAEWVPFAVLILCGLGFKYGEDILDWFVSITGSTRASLGSSYEHPVSSDPDAGGYTSSRGR